MAEHRKHQQDPHVTGDFDREIGFRGLGIFMLVIAAITVIAFVSMWYFGTFLKESGDAGDAPGSPLVAKGQTTVPPLPHLQVESYADWASMKAENARILRSYGWADRESGLVRIPITEAMQRLAESGLPQFEIVGDGSLDAPAGE